MEIIEVDLEKAEKIFIDWCVGQARPRLHPSMFRSKAGEVITTQEWQHMFWIESFHDNWNTNAGVQRSMFL